MSAQRDRITRLLQGATAGDREALDALLPAVYEELRGLARSHMGRERIGHTLGATALVHEAYLKLVDQDRIEWRDRGHFFGVASTAMRRILVNHALARRAEKRGGDADRVPLELAPEIAGPSRPEEILALDEALRRLEGTDERAARVIECRFFGGLGIEETAEALGVSPTTVKRDWVLAKTWLKRELAAEPG